ncbi:MAG: hypothetical protein J0L52_07130 [Caulobacterales bacterium]|nr:hypothetical protein [Caulobacterales bacterium]
MNAFVRRSSLIGILCTSLVVAACQTPVVEPPPPPPAPLPSVALNRSVAEAAAVYMSYVNSSSALSASFSNGGEVRQSMLRAAAYEPSQLSRGMVAYAAILALQSPEFVNGVRTMAADPTNRDTLLRRIISDPAYATQLPGAAEAAGLIASQIQGDGNRMYAAGAAIKQTAYDIQRQRWSSQHVTDRDARLEQVRLLGLTPLSTDFSASASLQQAALNGTGLNVTPARGSAPYTQAVVRGLALAALASLGQAGEDNRVQTEALLNEPVSADCLNFTRLMILQCLAASRPHYEEIFCLGQHLMMDTAQCVIDSAGSFTASAWPETPMLSAEQPAIQPAGAASGGPSDEAQTPNR